MVSLLSSLNMTANTLSVNEKAISVVSHNVANMNTEGYHKQRVNLVTRNIAGAIGDSVYNQANANGGVKIANIMRYNDEYLNNYYRDQLSDKSLLEQQLGNLKELADIFNDLDGTGIDAALSDFYESLNNLHEYPASSTARTNFIERAKTLVSTLNTKSIQLGELTSTALGDGVHPETLENSKIYVQYRELNNSLEELASVNKALQTTQTGTLTANNLLDKRDLILNDIAKFIDIKIEENPNGSVNISTGGVDLVKGAKVVGSFDIQTASQFCGNQDPVLIYPDDWVEIDKDGNVIAKEKAVLSIINPEDPENPIVENANDIIQGGALGGLLHSGTDNSDGVTNAGTVLNTLNKLTATVADIFNVLNTRDGAYCINPGNTAQLQDSAENNYLFGTYDEDGNFVNTGITAGNIMLNPELLTTDGIWNIACAYFKDEDYVDLNAVGNAQNVAAMLNTRSEKRNDLNGMSVEDYYSSLLGKIASAGDSTQTLYDTQCDVVDSVLAQMDSSYGVDLNEELVDLVKYQTAYSAAAQVFNACNSCIDVLINLGG